MFKNIDFDLLVWFGILLIVFVISINLYYLVNIIKRLIQKRLNFKSPRTQYHMIFGLLSNLLLIPLAIFPTYNRYSSDIPRIENSYPKVEGVWDSYDKPLLVEFDQPVSTYRLRSSINPEMKGRWEWEPYFFIDGLTRKGKFYPEESLLPDTRIVVYITGIGRPLIEEGHEFGFVFDSVKLSEVVSSQPFNKTDNIKTDSKIVLNLDKPKENNTEFTYEITPTIEFTVIEKDSNIEIIPSQDLQQSQVYTVNVKRKGLSLNLNTLETLDQTNPELIFSSQFTTVDAPLVKRFTPRGTGVLPEETIKLKFSREMDISSVESKIRLEPTFANTFKWVDNKNLEIIPTTAFPKDTQYKIILDSGAKSLEGGTSEQGAEFNFKTIGHVLIANTNPTNGSVKVNEASDIKVTFDQEVDKQSAESKFVITPFVQGSFSWDKNTLIFNPSSNLGYNITYTITLKSGIKSILGLDSNIDQKITFTTRTNQVMLAGIPQYYQPQQPQSFSCNIYAAKMGLAYKGYNETIVNLIAEMGYNDNRSNNQWTGNPYTEYVGTYDGGWGYGVYWNPVNELFINRGIDTDLHVGWNINDLARAIEQGHPVIIWRYNGESANKNINWTASDGTNVYAISGQHGGVVTGFRGTVDNPTAFYLNDPWYGLTWINASSFDYYWSRLNRVGIVIK